MSIWSGVRHSTAGQDGDARQVSAEAGEYKVSWPKPAWTWIHYKTHTPKFEKQLSLMMNLAEAHQHGCLTSFANLLARRGDHKRALPLLLICINHTSTAAETKARAGKLAGELKEKMTLAEIESAQIFSETSTVEAVTRDFLETVSRSEPPRLGCPENDQAPALPHGCRQ